jgi:hypothetical protein
MEPSNVTTSVITKIMEQILLDDVDKEFVIKQASDSESGSHSGSETSNSDDSDTSEQSSVSETKYAKDVLFGNEVYKNKLFEHKFSKILEFLEFSKENRGVSKEHVENIYNHYLKNPDEFIKPLDIMCFYKEGMDTDHFYIADGQHRFHALKKLYEDDGIDRDVLYFIHDVKSEEDIRRCIKYLNSSNPVTSIYSFEKIPDFINKISAKYTNIFSSNTNHQNDKMNEITLRDHLEEVKLFKDTELGVDEIYNLLLKFNQQTKDDFLKRIDKPSGDKKLFNKIASTHQFYGLIFRDYTWVNEFYNYVKEKTPESESKTDS